MWAMLLLCKWLSKIQVPVWSGAWNKKHLVFYFPHPKSLVYHLSYKTLEHQQTKALPKSRVSYVSHTFSCLQICALSLHLQGQMQLSGRAHSLHADGFMFHLWCPKSNWKCLPKTLESCLSVLTILANSMNWLGMKRLTGFWRAPNLPEQ